MTISEIANIAQVSQRTVRRVVAQKYPEKMRNGHKTTFSRDEATAVMAELRKPGFVTPLPGHNAKAPRQNAEPCLSGALLREMRLSVKAGILTPADPRRLLGLDTPPALPEPVASSSIARDGFAALGAIAGGLPSDIISRAARAGAAATEATIRRELARFVVDSKQGRLPL